MTNKVAFKTFGCKLNFAETSTIRKTFVESGYEVVDFKEKAEVYIINSCTVTENAEKKCKEAIRRAKRLNPSSKVAIVGCYSQLRPEDLASSSNADIILGNAEKFHLQEYLNTNESSISTKDIFKDKNFYPSYSIDGRTRAFVKIQDGCDYFCTFCAIPFARGNTKSDTIENTVKIVKEVVLEGQKEIVLTGVNIGTYGKHLGNTLFDLLKALEKIEGLERIRIGSVEPNLITFEMIDYIKLSDKILPHFHIPLQSGSNEMLKKMQRKYERDVFKERVAYIKDQIPLACIASDVIVGFPGETDRHFMETYHFIEELPLSYLHVFTYSDRPEAKASKMKGKIHSAVKKDRSERLHELAQIKKRNFYRENTQKTHHVLWEASNRSGRMFGLTENYIQVSRSYDPKRVGVIEKVFLSNIDQRGEWII
jgi:threonylcarbamoyladenosine tRNA methylthiotransferase MtaB